MASSLPLLLPPYHLALSLASLNSAESVYRGSYPHARNLRFLRRLGLRTVLSLTPGPLPEATLAWAEKQGIQCIWLEVGAAGEESLGTGLKEAVKEGLQVLLDSTNLPAYIHCSDGGVNTSAVLGGLRRMQGWSTDSIVAETLRFDPTPSSPNPALVPCITSLSIPAIPTGPTAPTWIVPPPPPPTPSSRKPTSSSMAPPPPPSSSNSTSSIPLASPNSSNPSNPTPPHPPHSHPLSRVATHESTFAPSQSPTPSVSRPLSRVSSRAPSGLLSPNLGGTDDLADDSPTPLPFGTPKRPRTPSVVLHPPSVDRTRELSRSGSTSDDAGSASSSGGGGGGGISRRGSLTGASRKPEEVVLLQGGDHSEVQEEIVREDGGVETRVNGRVADGGKGEGSPQGPGEKAETEGDSLEEDYEEEEEEDEDEDEEEEEEYDSDDDDEEVGMRSQLLSALDLDGYG